MTSQPAGKDQQSKAKRAFATSERFYLLLLMAYPRRYRQRFGEEMVQVFRACCRAAYQSAGVRGVWRLWLPILWDWALTATREQLYSLFNRRLEIMDTTAFDRQLGDLVWMLITGLRAGFDLQQVFEELSHESPDPTASACKDLTADLQAGLTFEAAFAKIKKKIPSPYLAEVIAALQAHQQVGGDPQKFLEPIGKEILEKVGSDKTFSEAMRRLASAVKAQPPEE